MRGVPSRLVAALAGDYRRSGRLCPWSRTRRRVAAQRCLLRHPRRRVAAPCSPMPPPYVVPVHCH